MDSRHWADTFLDRMPTISASAAFEELLSRGPDNEISGLQSFDSLVQNGNDSTQVGFERGKVTELWGPSGAGKTALMWAARASVGTRKLMTSQATDCDHVVKARQWRRLDR